MVLGFPPNCPVQIPPLFQHMNYTRQGLGCPSNNYTMLQLPQYLQNQSRNYQCPQNFHSPPNSAQPKSTEGETEGCGRGGACNKVNSRSVIANAVKQSHSANRLPQSFLLRNDVRKRNENAQTQSLLWLCQRPLPVLLLRLLWPFLRSGISTAIAANSCS